MAMDGQRNGHGRHLTYHPNRYNSPIDMKRTQSDTRQVLNSHTVATAARIHRSACETSRRWAPATPVGGRKIRWWIGTETDLGRPCARQLLPDWSLWEPSGSRSSYAWAVAG